MRNFLAVPIYSNLNISNKQKRHGVFEVKEDPSIEAATAFLFFNKTEGTDQFKEQKSIDFFSQIQFRLLLLCPSFPLSDNISEMVGWLCARVPYNMALINPDLVRWSTFWQIFRWVRLSNLLLTEIRSQKFIFIASRGSYESSDKRKGEQSINNLNWI